MAQDPRPLYPILDKVSSGADVEMERMNEAFRGACLRITVLTVAVRQLMVLEFERTSIVVDKGRCAWKVCSNDEGRLKKNQSSTERPSGSPRSSQRDKRCQALH